MRFLVTSWKLCLSISRKCLWKIETHGETWFETLTTGDKTKYSNMRVESRGKSSRRRHGCGHSKWVFFWYSRPYSSGVSSIRSITQSPIWRFQTGWERYFSEWGLISPRKAYFSLAVCEFFYQNSIQALPHLSYRHDLALCDLSNECFRSSEEMLLKMLVCKPSGCPPPWHNVHQVLQFCILTLGFWIVLNVPHFITNHNVVHIFFNY